MQTVVDVILGRRTPVWLVAVLGLVAAALWLASYGIVSWILGAGPDRLYQATILALVLDLVLGGFVLVRLAAAVCRRIEEESAARLEADKERRAIRAAVADLVRLTPKAGILNVEEAPWGKITASYSPLPAP